MQKSREWVRFMGFSVAELFALDVEVHYEFVGSDTLQVKSSPPNPALSRSGTAPTSHPAPHPPAATGAPCGHQLCSPGVDMPQEAGL